jgi:death on curing protein
MRPLFLTLAEVLAIHRDQTERYGGAGGVRDLGLLQSAIAAPQTRFGGKFLHRDLFDMAAAYLFHIARNHPFVDGNKRTAAVAAAVFLNLNDLALTADEESFEEQVRMAAEGRTGKEELALFFRRNGAPVTKPYR